MKMINFTIVLLLLTYCLNDVVVLIEIDKHGVSEKTSLFIKDKDQFFKIAYYTEFALMFFSIVGYLAGFVH